MTNSYVKLKVSTPTYNEIYKLLEAAGYADQFIDKGGKILVNMHGLALERDESHDDDCMDCGVSVAERLKTFVFDKSLYRLS